MNRYLHGYSARETQRLDEQSAILQTLLHAGTAYPPGTRVLEAGCGVGAQTRILAERSPGASFVSVDISQASLERARAAAASAKAAKGTFFKADLLELPFAPERFDHLFVCFVLEHLSDPLRALGEMRAALKPGGTLTAIEGDHGSCFWHPETSASRHAWASMIASQRALGHDPCIGRRLYPLLCEAGFSVREVAPRWVYTDANDPALMDAVLGQIIVPMVRTAKARSVEDGLIGEARFEQGVRDLEGAGQPPEGTFFYTWFKALAVKEP